MHSFFSASTPTSSAHTLSTWTDKTSSANGFGLLSPIQGPVQGGGLRPVRGHDVPSVCQARHQQHLSDDAGDSLHCTARRGAEEVGAVLPALRRPCGRFFTPLSVEEELDFS